jgi:hypothetical protein
MADPAGLIGVNNAHTGAHARPAQQSDPLGEMRRDLAAVLALLEATRAQGMGLGGKKLNRLGHALEAAKREVRRALEATGAGDAGPG